MSKVDEYIEEIQGKEILMIATYTIAPIIIYMGWQEHIPELLVIIGVWIIAIRDKTKLIDRAKLEGIDIDEEIRKKYYSD